MPTATEQAAAQGEQQVHASASQAVAVLNKLAGQLKQAGADPEVVKQIDDAANTVNSIASAVVGNVADAAPEAAPQSNDLGSAIKDFHDQEVTAAGGQPRY